MWKILRFLTVVFAKGDEVLTRFGDVWEDASRLAEQAATAEGHPHFGIHGVSVTARPTPHGKKTQREDVEKVFVVHNTPTMRDKLHRTVELPKPVTAEVAEQFNRLFGRTQPE